MLRSSVVIECKEEMDILAALLSEWGKRETQYIIDLIVEKPELFSDVIALSIDK